MHRKDRVNRLDGGFFVAVSNKFTSHREVDIETDCEMVCVRLTTLEGNKVIFISYYRPPSSHIDNTINLRVALDRLFAKYRDPTVVIGGDVNFPFIDWATQVNTSSLENKSAEEFLQCLGIYSFEQMVEEPTRKDHLLDIILTNKPTVLQNVNVAPGISDHHLINAEVMTNIAKISKIKRTVYQYDRGDYIGFKDYLLHNFNRYSHEFSNTGVDKNWEKFHSLIHQAIGKFIPS